MSLSPKELEYLSECEAIQIVPNFNRSKMYLISGDVGPFRAGLPLQVPLWMAVDLRQSSKCKIVTPDWMSKDVLEAIKSRELNSEDQFAKLPQHFMAFGKLLFDACPGEIEDADEVKTLMKDIWDIRASKLRRSVKDLLSRDMTSCCTQVDNLTMMEMCEIRPFLTHSLEQIYRIKKTVSENINRTETAMEAAEYSQTQDLSRSTMNMTHSSSTNSQSQTQ